MGTKRKMTFPVILTFIIICVIIYLFTNIKQSEIVCDKTFTFDSDILLYETATITLDNKKINGITLNKKIILPDNIERRSEKIIGIKNALDSTLNYLEDDVSYSILDNGINVKIDIHDNDDLVLLGNLNFYVNDNDLDIEINANTKSSSVITLAIGDNYTDGELMKKLKNNGYRCK